MSDISLGTAGVSNYNNSSSSSAWCRQPGCWPGHDGQVGGHRGGVQQVQQQHLQQRKKTAGADPGVTVHSSQVCCLTLWFADLKHQQ
jgi:hypothetical protein